MWTRVSLATNPFSWYFTDWDHYWKLLFKTLHVPQQLQWQGIGSFSSSSDFTLSLAQMGEVVIHITECLTGSHTEYECYHNCRPGKGQESTPLGICGRLNQFHGNEAWFGWKESRLVFSLLFAACTLTVRQSYSSSYPWSTYDTACSYNLENEKQKRAKLLLLLAVRLGINNMPRSRTEQKPVEKGSSVFGDSLARLTEFDWEAEEKW